MKYEEIMKATGNINTSFTTSKFQIRSLSGMCVQMMGEYSINAFAFGVNLDKDMEEKIGNSNYIELELANIVSIDSYYGLGEAFKTFVIAVK